VYFVDSVPARADERRVLQTLWPSVLAAAVAAGGSALRWAVMSTGDLDGADQPVEPVNEARLFDIATGEVLLRQRKVHRFDLESYMIAGNYPLPASRLRRARRSWLPTHLYSAPQRWQGGT
jgi:hypothetical protein